MRNSYICDICKRVLDNRRQRLQHQTFSKPPYSRVIIEENIDLCIPCYNKVKKYIQEMQDIFKEV